MKANKDVIIIKHWLMKLTLGSVLFKIVIFEKAVIIRKYIPELA